MKLETKSGILCAAGAGLIVIMTSAFKTAISGAPIDAMHILWMMLSSQMAADMTGNSIDTTGWAQALNPLNYLFSPMLISAFLGFQLGDILATTRRKPAIQRRKTKQQGSAHKNLGRAALEYKAITGDESFLSDVMVSDVSVENAAGEIPMNLEVDLSIGGFNPASSSLGDNP